MHPPLFTGKMLFTLLTLFGFIGVITTVLPIPRFTTTVKGFGNANLFQQELATELQLNQQPMLVKQKSW